MVGWPPWAPVRLDMPAASGWGSGGGTDTAVWGCAGGCRLAPVGAGAGDAGCLVYRSMSAWLGTKQGQHPRRKGAHGPRMTSGQQRTTHQAW